MIAVAGTSLAVFATVAAVLCTGGAALPYLFVLGYAAVVGPRGAPAPRHDVTPPVSIVLPTRNEAAIVERKLEELVDLDYPTDRLEVVLADDSTDDTPAITRSFFAERDEPELTIVSGAGTGVATAVNRAVAAASHDVIFRTDCDARLAPDAVRKAVGALATDDVGLVTGRQSDVVGEGGEAVETDYRGLLERVQAVETSIDSTFIVHGPASAFEREAFAPLPPDTVADDTAIGVAIRRTGKRVVMDPAVRFAEAAASGLRERRLRKDRRALGLVQQLVRNWDLLGRCGRYGRVVLPLNWFFLVAGPWLLFAAVVAITIATLAAVGRYGVLVPVAILGVVWLGSRERLGPLQPVHAVIDAQLSLLVGAIRLVGGGIDGTWERDSAAREAFE